MNGAAGKGGHHVAYTSSAHVHVSLLLRSNEKHKFKDKIIRNFKLATAKH